MLVLAPLLTAPVEPNAYVTVIGEVMRFDIADRGRADEGRHAGPAAGRGRKVPRQAGDHRHLGDQQRDDRSRQAAAAADDAGGSWR